VDKDLGERPNPIAFRLEDTYAARLRLLADALGTAPGKLAKRFVQERLDADLGQEVSSKLDAVHKDVRALRVDLATAIRVLLVTSGSQTDEAAKRWVEQHLLNQ